VNKYLYHGCYNLSNQIAHSEVYKITFLDVIVIAPYTGKCIFHTVPC